MTDSAINKIDPVVQRLVQESPDLKGAARFYGAILPVLRGANLRIIPVCFTREQAQAKMGKGLPLLSNVNLEIDEEALSNLLMRLAEAVETASEQDKSTTFAVDARRIRMAFNQNRLNIGELLCHIAAEDNNNLKSYAESLQLNEGLLGMLAKNAFKTALIAWQRQLTPVAGGISWRNGYCFICGAKPTLGELRENTLAKYLRCGQCGADWPVKRLQCIYCGNEDHKTLNYLYSENMGKEFRVDVCDKCRGYLKVIFAFSATPAEMLAIEDLATLHLDFIAEEKGYSRGVAKIECLS